MINLNRPLYDYIIKNLGAYCKPDKEKAKSNLENTPEENKQYLGTYSPKSFKESYVIFSDIFTVLKEYGFFNFKDEINILDLGSGTGAQMFGLLQVLEEKINSQLNINIYSIDGNMNALEIQHKIFSNFWKENFQKNKICWKYHHKAFNNGDEIASLVFKLCEPSSMDIVLSFKFLSELLKYDNLAYEKTIKACERILKNDGILVFDDVTMEIKTLGQSEEQFIPYTLNKNITKYMQQPHQLNIVAPLCCFYNKNKCKRDWCYSQCSTYSYMLTDKGKENILCKIDYRLFIKNGNLYDNIVDKFLNKFTDKCFKNCFFKQTLDFSDCYCISYKCGFKRYFGDNINFEDSQFSLVKLKKIYDGQSENETYSGDIVIRDDDVPY